MSRATVAQRRPDTTLDWTTFPRSRLAPGTVLYRAARRGRSPWWFCACGDCRFDLTGGRGTCYTGTDETSGLLESIGAEWAAGATMTPEFLRMRVVHALPLQRALPLANLSSPRVVGFRVTNELASMTPYDIPQAFARLFDGVTAAAGRLLHGIRCRTRFNTRAAPRGVALFGDAGVQDLGSGWEREVDDALLSAIRRLGVVVDDPPARSGLVLAPDPVRARARVGDVEPPRHPG